MQLTKSKTPPRPNFEKKKSTSWGLANSQVLWNQKGHSGMTILTQGTCKRVCLIRSRWEADWMRLSGLTHLESHLFFAQKGLHWAPETCTWGSRKLHGTPCGANAQEQKEPSRTASNQRKMTWRLGRLKQSRKRIPLCWEHWEWFCWYRI